MSEAFEKEFKEYSKKNIEDTGLWRPLSDREFAKHFYLAATERAAGIAENYDKTEENWGTWCRARVAKEIAQKIRGKE